MILPFGDRRPRIDATTWLPETAVVIGDVVTGPSRAVVSQRRRRARRPHRRAHQREDNATIHVMKGRFATGTHLIRSRCFSPCRALLATAG
jgi:carbonic anhydrase/acetyltransferase-like protein (isoleucine patch superfamily)